MSGALNLVLHQVGWFACVLGLSWGFQVVGSVIAVCLVGIHVALATDRRGEIGLCVAAAALGLLIDAGQMAAGVFSFPQGPVIGGLPPPAITILWIQFATTLRYSLGWLSQQYAVAAAFGFCGAPLAFYAGEKLGAIQFAPPRLASFLVLGLLWAVAIPTLVWIADRRSARSSIRAGYRGPTKPEPSE